MENEKLLMTPGPTMLPPSVLEIMRRQIIHHRTKEFEEILNSLANNLKIIFQTKNLVMTFASSGTGVMESAIVNLFSPGDKVLSVSIGNFGDRFAQIAEAFQLDVVKLKYEWGQAVKVSDIKDILQNAGSENIKGILITHNETSTGVTNDIKAVAELTKNTDILLVVDAISSLGGLELKMDEWGVDCVVTGSQKALMAPPGLGFVALSDKAWAACNKSTMPKFYWDYKKYKKGLDGIGENPPFTPAITTMQAQAVALKLILEEGIENVYARHKKLALATQAGIKSLGLELLANQENSSYIITAVKAPEGIDISKVIKTLNQKFNIMITGGQKELKGKIFRIGHCGFVSGPDLIKTFSALEMALSQEGYIFESGISLKAVQNELKN